MSDPYIRGLYIVFSKAFFVPEMFENPTVVSEPFQSALHKLLEATRQTYQDQELEKLKEPWESACFIPFVGQLEFDLKKNVVSRLLLRRNVWLDSDGEYERYWFDSSLNSPYLESGDFNKLLHFPIHINYKKKIRIEPTVTQFIGKRPNLNNQSQNITQNVKFYVHLYPTGIFFLHLAIALQSPLAIPVDDIAPYLYGLKVAHNPRSSDKISLNTRHFHGPLEGFFHHIWEKISSAFFERDLETVYSKTHDFVRIKPIEHIDLNDFVPHERSTADIYRSISHHKHRKRSRVEMHWSISRNLGPIPDDTWESFKATFNKAYGTNLQVSPLWATVELADIEGWTHEPENLIYVYVRQFCWNIDLDHFFSYSKLKELVRDYRHLGNLLREGQLELKRLVSQINQLETTYPILQTWDGYNWLPASYIKEYLPNFHKEYGHLYKGPLLEFHQGRFEQQNRDVIDQLESLESRMRICAGMVAALPYVHQTVKQFLLNFIRSKQGNILSAQEIYGLMTKDPRYKSKEIDPQSVQSVWGYNQSDFFLPKSNSTLMFTNSWSMRKHLQLFLQWKLLSAFEVARFQSMVADHYSRKIQSILVQKSVSHTDSAADRLTQRQLDALYCLVNLHDHFPPDWRKWFYQQAAALGTFKSLAKLRAALEQYLGHFQSSLVVDLSNAIVHQLQIGNQNIMVSGGDFVAGDKIMGDKVLGDKFISAGDKML